jgi:hypothetical protein
MGIIGNAVAVAVAETIGRSLIEHCELAPNNGHQPVASRPDGPAPRNLAQATK